MTLSVDAAVLLVPTVKETLEPFTSEKLDGVAVTAYVLRPVEAPPINADVPPNVGPSGVKSPSSAVMSLLTPAIAALPKQVISAL